MSGKFGPERVRPAARNVSGPHEIVSWQLTTTGDPDTHGIVVSSERDDLTDMVLIERVDDGGSSLPQDRVCIWQLTIMCPDVLVSAPGDTAVDVRIVYRDRDDGRQIVLTAPRVVGVKDTLGTQDGEPVRLIAADAVGKYAVTFTDENTQEAPHYG